MSTNTAMRPEQVVDLWGNVEDVFVSAKERYGVWPVTVWDCDMSDPTTRRLKAAIGDTANDTTAAWCHSRPTPNSVYFKRHEAVDGTYGFMGGASIFNPAVAAWALNMYAPKRGLCFDPFAGGGTRAIMAAKHGLLYRGWELRAEECEAVRARVAAQGETEGVEIVQGDSRDIGEQEQCGCADFLLTCPPYYNLERYGGGVGDLSECVDYCSFLRGLRQCVEGCRHVLKRGALAIWVVGLFRDNEGTLVPFHHDVTRLHTENGFRMREEIVLALRNNGAVQRVGNFEKGQRHLIRTHEYALVFER
ncbi:MAG: hypothetical protein ACYTEQ_28830 [Planctomycetota bacterium]|jgi:hypothetical protein